MPLSSPISDPGGEASSLWDCSQLAGASTWSDLAKDTETLNWGPYPLFTGGNAVTKERRLTIRMTVALSLRGCHWRWLAQQRAYCESGWHAGRKVRLPTGIAYEINPDTQGKSGSQTITLTRLAGPPATGRLRSFRLGNARMPADAAGGVVANAGNTDLGRIS
jgi:hypothetical protein